MRGESTQNGSGHEGAELCMEEEGCAVTAKAMRGLLVTWTPQDCRPDHERKFRLRPLNSLFRQAGNQHVHPEKVLKAWPVYASASPEFLEHEFAQNAYADQCENCLCHLENRNVQRLQSECPVLL